MKPIRIFTVAFILGLIASNAWPVDSDGYTMLVKTGRFERLQYEIDRALNNDTDMPMNERLRLMKFKTSALFGTRQLKECLDLCNDMIEMDKPDSLRYYDVNAYICMNDILCSLDLFDPARQAIEKAEETIGVIRSKIDGDRLRRIEETVLMSKSVLAQTEGDLPGALREWNKVRISEHSGNTRKLIWYGLGGSIYHDLGDTAKAQKYFGLALAIRDCNPNRIPILLRLMSIDIQSGDYAGALELLEKYRASIGEVDNPLLRSMLLHAEGDALHGLGRDGEAADRYYTALIMSDSVADENNRLVNQLLAESISPADYSALEKRIEDARAQNQRVIIIALSAGLILLIVLLCIMVLKVRESRRALKTEEKMIRMNQEHRQRTTELAQELSSRQKEICELSMAAAQTESTIVTIRTEIQRSTSSTEDRLRSIESALRETVSDKNLQETFKAHFDSTNQQLYARLTLRHPDLTKAELNMAAYILLNLNSKEIARMTNRSVRTVDNIKYSLRRKLGIDEPIHAYLCRLLES